MNTPKLNFIRLCWAWVWKVVFVDLLYLWEPLVMKWAVSIWLWRDRYGWKLILFISIFGGLHALLLGRHLADRTQAVGTNKFHIFTKQSILSPFSAPFLMLYTDVVNIVAGLKMASGRAQTVFPQLSEAHVNSYELSTVWPINSSDVKISGTAKSSSEKPKVSLSRGCYHTVWNYVKKSHWPKMIQNRLH